MQNEDSTNTSDFPENNHDIDHDGSACYYDNSDDDDVCSANDDDNDRQEGLERL